MRLNLLPRKTLWSKSSHEYSYMFLASYIVKGNSLVRIPLDIFVKCDFASPSDSEYHDIKFHKNLQMDTSQWITINHVLFQLWYIANILKSLGDLCLFLSFETETRDLDITLDFFIALSPWCSSRLQVLIPSPFNFRIACHNWVNMPEINTPDLTSI